MKKLNFDELVVNNSVEPTNDENTRSKRYNIEFLETQSVGSWCEEHGGSVEDLKFIPQKNNPDKIIFVFNGQIIYASNKLDKSRRVVISKCKNTETGKVFFMIHNERTK